MRRLAALCLCLGLAGCASGPKAPTSMARETMQTQGCGWNGDEPCNFITPPPIHKQIGQAPEAGPPPSLAVTVYTLDAVPQCVPCSALGPRTLDMAPSKDWSSATVDLAYAWMRIAVSRGDVPYPDGDYVPPSAWTRIYPTINFCTNNFTIGAVSGTWTGTACAAGASFNDSLMISMADRARIKPLIAWEACNQVIYYHLHNWLLSDGSAVGACCNFVLVNNP